MLLALVVLAGAILGVLAVAVAVDNDGSPDRAASAVTADVSGLRNGDVLPVAVKIPRTGLPPNRDERTARVFFVRRAGQIDAYLGVSTHLGCSLLIPGDPKYGRGFSEIPGDPKIEDPCGGSTYAFDGRCVGGPCPRDLDRYDVRMSGDTAVIDLGQLIAGPARDSR